MPPNITNLPPALLHGLFRSLMPKDLAALAVQNKYLQSESVESDVWKSQALSKWPGADVALYDGSWPRLYAARARVPSAAFPLAADRIRAITQSAQARAAAGGDHDLLGNVVEDVMRCVHSVAIAVVGCPVRLRATREFAMVRQDVCWWLAERPDVVVRFARSATASLHTDADMDAVAYGAFADAAWRRDAVVALSTLGFLTGAHPSVAGRLRREAQVLAEAVAAAQS